MIKDQGENSSHSTHHSIILIENLLRKILKSKNITTAISGLYTQVLANFEFFEKGIATYFNSY